MLSRAHSIPYITKCCQILGCFLLLQCCKKCGAKLKSVQSGYILTSRHPPAEWVSGGHLSPPPPILNGPQLLPNPPPSLIFNKGPLNGCFFGRCVLRYATHPTHYYDQNTSIPPKSSERSLSLQFPPWSAVTQFCIALPPMPHSIFATFYLCAMPPLFKRENLQ